MFTSKTVTYTVASPGLYSYYKAAETNASDGLMVVLLSNIQLCTDS
jgi:hypothetical protein